MQLFSIYSIFTTFRHRKDDFRVIVVAGGISGCISWIPTYPFDVIKTRLQGDSLGNDAKYKGSLHCLKHTVSQTGWNILYRGFGSCMYRAFVVNAVVLSVYSFVIKQGTPLPVPPVIIQR
jgi:hypothetical protein